MVLHATDFIRGRESFDAAQALARYDVDIDGSIYADSDTAVSMLMRLYPKQTITTDTDRETWRKQFWSVQQQAAEPALIFQPTSAKEVAVALLVCRLVQVKFAVKSGGHAAMAGASSAGGGVVIDLQNLNSVELIDNKSIARLGTGGRWEHVFEKLAKDGVAVAGGRAGDVGVGGYTLGGGISFFASTRGWACDNIRNYELVTAQGEILDVNYQSYPELFWALRGGGANFGIVTRFDYETFPQGDIYAGSAIYEYEQKDRVVKAFTSLAHDSDPKSATWLCAAQHEGKKFFNALVMHAEPNTECDIVRAYSAIPSVHASHKIRSMADMASEITAQNVREYRQYFWNHTFKFDPEFVAWIFDTFLSEMRHEVDRTDSLLASIIVMQYYTKEAVALMQRDGGNCLPLTVNEAPYVNLLIPNSWKDEKDDELAYGLARKFMDVVIAEGKRRDLFVDFVYMNYGSCYQDVLKGYGRENYDKLQEVAAKHDPDGVFQKLAPAYFKFGGAPA